MLVIFPSQGCAERNGTGGANQYISESVELNAIAAIQNPCRRRHSVGPPTRGSFVIRSFVIRSFIIEEKGNFIVRYCTACMPYKPQTHWSSTLPVRTGK